MNKKYITNKVRIDGFGAQFQTIIFTILYSEFNNIHYVHTPIKNMQHNYDNDSNFIENINNFINLKENYTNINDVDKNDIINCHISIIYNDVETNIDKYKNNNPCFLKIKNCFWAKKNKNYYNINKFNVAIHIRRQNKHDTRIKGTDTPDTYYINIINNIRDKYKYKDLLFHIYSQGTPDMFDIYKNDDVILHINEELTSTFIGLVLSDILVTSSSSFSYIAAILSDAEVYYLPFWHKPKANWISI